MHIVVTQFELKNTVDWSVLQSQVEQFQEKLLSEYPEFQGVSLVRVNDNKAIIVVLFTNQEALANISKNKAAPWFAENVMPHLNGTVDRQVGEIVAGSLKSKSELQYQSKRGRPL